MTRPDWNSGTCSRPIRTGRTMPSNALPITRMAAPSSSERTLARIWIITWSLDAASKERLQDYGGTGRSSGRFGTGSRFQAPALVPSRHLSGKDQEAKQRSRGATMATYDFELDSRLDNDSLFLMDWPLCR